MVRKLPFKLNLIKMDIMMLKLLSKSFCSSLVKASFKQFNKPYFKKKNAMFRCCSNLESLNLNINAVNVTNMFGMFDGCSKLKRINGISQSTLKK